MDIILVPVTDSIYKLVIALPYGGDVNCYFIKGARGYTVVDTGIYSEQSIEQWESILSSGIIIEKIVLTHTHPDHIGLAGWLQKRLSVPVFMSKMGFNAIRKVLQQWLDYKGDENQPYVFLLKHGGPEVPYKRMLQQLSASFFEPDGFFEDEQVILLGDEMYEAVWTPGHAPDHFCFFNRKIRILFAGDHVLSDISPVVTLLSDEGGNPLHDYFQSLEQIENYTAELVLPGHGGPISDLKQRVSEIRKGHLFRMGQIIDILGEEGITAGDVSRILYNNKYDNRFIAQIQSTLSRLTYLELQGQVSSRIQNGIVLFFRNRL